MRKNFINRMLFNDILIIDVLQTGLCFVYIDAHFVCLYCLPAFSLSALRLTKFY